MKIGCHNGGEVLCRAVLNISENRSQYIDVGIGGRSTETAEKREANSFAELLVPIDENTIREFSSI